ncbi:hypothetical protein NHX12_020506 [Muraenolepis orangiensis]|uniref:Protein Wnt n=1 Tax=Muraenolepis orangiensis TaxID=630683 RepID=A0A9Q0EV08_9TELE|nr:hypothetical protein NHX12_020506 [Muraenolepis orangiensis]
MAAGLVHSITRACSQGSMAECGCDASLQGLGSPTTLQGLGSPTTLQGLGSPTTLQGLGPPTTLEGLGSPTTLEGLGPPTTLEGLGPPTSLQGLAPPTEGWHWGGCSDHTRYAAWFSRRFLDGSTRNASKLQATGHALPATGHALQATGHALQATGHALLAANQHNSDVGRQAVDRTMVTDCRCHGVSGSCAVKTCWRSVAPLERVGAVLKEAFENSVEVRRRSAGQKVRRRKEHKLMRRQPVGRDQLVYLNKSPNYCVEDRRRGILGTRGRQCSRTSRGPDGCSLLCCGRGYNTHVVRSVRRCHCKFVWCCNVRCRRCESMTDIHTCK